MIFVFSHSLLPKQMFNRHEFVNLPEIYLLVSFIGLWSDRIQWVISAFLNLVSFVLCPRMWSMFHGKTFHGMLNMKYTPWCLDKIFCRYVRYIWCMASFNFNISLKFFFRWLAYLNNWGFKIICYWIGGLCLCFQ